MDNDEKKNRLKALLNEQAEPETAHKPTPAAGGVFYINGAGAVIGQMAAGDIHNHTTYNTEKVIQRPKVEVKTGDGVVSAEQKARLQQLVKDWVDTYNAVHVQKKTFGAAWGAVNKQVNVLNTYQFYKIIENRGKGSSFCKHRFK